MADPTLDDLGVKAQNVAAVEDDVLADAKARAEEAEQDDLQQTVASIDNQLASLRAEERALSRGGNAKPAKLQALRKRIQSATARKQSLYEAHDERRRIAVVNQAAASTAVSDDTRGEDESERDFLIRTGKLTPFQGQKGYERRSAIQPVETQSRKRLRPSTPPSDGDGESESNSEPDGDYVPNGSSAFSDEDGDQQSEEDEDADEDFEISKVKSSSRKDGSKKPVKKRRKSNVVDAGYAIEQQHGAAEGDDVDVSQEEEVEFDGGLRVPATVFDKLFAYQRTGVSNTNKLLNHVLLLPLSLSSSLRSIHA